jgi:predicted Zn-dependent peptidase
MAEIAKLRAGDFDEKLLTSAINNFKAGEMNLFDSNYGRAHSFVNSFVNGVEWKDAVEELDRISKITKDEIVAYANEHFTDNNCVVVYKRQGKDNSLVEMPKPQLTPLKTNRDAASAFVTEIMNSKPTPIEPVFVDYNKDMQRLKAKSDIEVLYKKNETTDLFQLVYLYEVGHNNDPTINFASGYLQYLGTADMSAEKRKAELYDIACNFNFGTSEERTYIIISGLRENMARAMELTEALMNGAVGDENILATLKNDWLKERTDRKLNQQANFNALRMYTQRGPEWIDANILTNDELAALPSEDLLAKFRAFSGQQHRILYYGPEAPAEVIATIEKNHNVAAQLEPVAEKVKYPIVATPSSSVLLAEYDAPQIYYMQYSNRGEMFDPTLEPIVTMYDTYFGGGMSSIVFQEMREARGLAYSANAWLSSPYNLDVPYTYLAFIATQNDKLQDAATAFSSIIDQMPESEAAFTLAKESIINNIRTERIIKSSVLWDYVNAQDLGIDYDTRRDVFEKVPAMTLADVKDFQQKWVAGRPYTYSILGRSADLDMEYLKTLGPVKQVSKEEIFGY